MASPRQRSRVLRSDGKYINIVHHRGHLLVCSKGCCCGLTERGHAPVPEDLYHQEWERRKLRNRVHLTQSGCLGPCPMSNTVLLVFDGHPIWFQSVNTDSLVLAIFDYIDAMVAADSYLPPPPALSDYVFDYYTWSHTDGFAPRAPILPRAAASVTPSGILLLTHKDTDLLTLASAIPDLPDGFPPVDAANLGALKTDAHMVDLLNQKAGTAQVIIARLLGRIGSVPGFPHLVEHARQHDQQLIVVSGTNSIEPEFTAISTVPLETIATVTRYFEADGHHNIEQLLRYVADHVMRYGFGYDAPTPQPEHGLYHPALPIDASIADWRKHARPNAPTVAILFYRSHWLSGNTEFIDALVAALERSGANALPIFTSSLRATRPPADDASAPIPLVLDWILDETGRPFVDVIVTTLSYAAGGVNTDGPTLSSWGAGVFAQLDIPVVQAITGRATRWQWDGAQRGLSPMDTAANVALPEFDGRIISVPISFKAADERVAGSDRADRTGAATLPPFDAMRYEPIPDRVDKVARLAMRYATLRRTPNAAKRVAFILTNSTGKAQSIGNAVGLDAPASLLRVFSAMQAAGYTITDLPPDGDTLIRTLIDRCSYDDTILTEAQLANAVGRVPAATYQRWFDSLPERQRVGMRHQWGDAPGQAYVHDDHLALAGLAFGNVFVALQPPRGYGMDPNAIYHTPDLPPPHNYYALYRWLRDVWRADAIVHMGKHGTLEWLPGKGVGLSADCFPDSFLDDLPLIYPFILNDPGEGAQAKRRAHAVIVDHLPPPMTTADGYGELAQLMQLVDEYYQVEQFDPPKLPLVQRQIWELIQQANLADDLALILNRASVGHVHEWDETVTEDGMPVSLVEMRGKDVAHLIEEMDGYLCELAGAQIRDGLHILGQTPVGDQLIDTLHALTRLPNLDVPSLPASIAATVDLDWAELQAHQGKRLRAPEPDDRAPVAQHLVVSPTTRDARQTRRRIASTSREEAQERLATLQNLVVTAGDAVQRIDEIAKHLLRFVADGGFARSAIDEALTATFGDPAVSNDVRRVLTFVCDHLAPTLQQTGDEIANLLRALDGGFVPAGPSGAPTRGMAHVLPTGRNFYAVDPRALPSMAAWEVGQGLAREVLERYRRETGAFPESVAISIWGTSTMRTYGDDAAEVLALLGVRPVWQRENHRVVGVELIPLAELGRPRIDVTVRISGFFRDAFPHLIALLNEAVDLVINADEPPEQNFVRAHYLAEIASGDTDDRAARYRVFGSKPGSYGAGILPLIDEQNWQTDQDFADAYIAWGGYAYTADAEGVDARAQFVHRLATVEVALHNQDNREHDIFDSDDYLQFHGGMIATIRALSGRQPKRYFGDTQNPATPKVRDLQEEALRVFRTRVVNPKWLERIQQHGYKGALEMAATVDYLFGYDATANVVRDFMYEQVAQIYALDPNTQAFFEQSNPWALRAIAERLLEAAQRGLWAEPRPETIAGLTAAALTADAMVEGRAHA